VGNTLQPCKLALEKNQQNIYIYIYIYIYKNTIIFVIKIKKKTLKLKITKILLEPQLSYWFEN
jgi:hypothetical protein